MGRIYVYMYMYVYMIQYDTFVYGEGQILFYCSSFVNGQITNKSINADDWLR